tara:strand:+ start:620 stop:811 length:192 start_codon:yes stop_codon:yes gene_type:complete
MATTIQDSIRIKPEGLCMCFDYINEHSDEGTCSITKNIVNLNAGCLNPLECGSYGIFLQGDKK